MNPKITVIIPVYNVENYLRDCLDSVTTQSLEDIEILCINDCSEDNSQVILKEYASHESRIRIINNDINRGLSFSRNVGVKHARGKYLYFVDSDDLLKPDALHELYMISEEFELDGVLFDTDVIYETIDLLKTDIYKSSRDATYNNVSTGNELFVEMLQNNDYDPCVWRQFWNKEFILQNKLFFYEGIIHEDVAFTFSAILSANKMKCINKSYYVYRRRQTSITTLQISPKNIEGIFLGVMEMMDFWKKHEFDNTTNQLINEYILKAYRHLQYLYSKVEMSQPIQFHDKVTNCLYDLLLHKNQQKMIDREKIIEKINTIKRFSNVIIYGAGMIAKELLALFNDYDISIVGVAVTCKEENPNSLMGNKIYGIDELLSYKDDCIVVIAVTPVYQKAMEEILQSRGFHTYINIL
jgi:Glycosyltransferases involved in cell wall biogenesis